MWFEWLHVAQTLSRVQTKWSQTVATLDLGLCSRFKLLKVKASLHGIAKWLHMAQTLSKVLTFCPEIESHHSHVTSHCSVNVTKHWSFEIYFLYKLLLNWLLFLVSFRACEQPSTIRVTWLNVELLDPDHNNHLTPINNCLWQHSADLLRWHQHLLMSSCQWAYQIALTADHRGRCLWQRVWRSVCRKHVMYLWWMWQANWQQQYTVFFWPPGSIAL